MLSPSMKCFETFWEKLEKKNEDLLPQHTTSTHNAVSRLMVTVWILVAILVYKGWQFTHFFLVALVILWTREPILGLFVLGWIHFSCGVQIWQWKFEFQENCEIVKKRIDNFGLPSVLDAGMGKVKVDWCIMWEFDLSLNLTLCIVCWNLSRWTQKWFYFRFPVHMRCWMLHDDVGE